MTKATNETFSEVFIRGNNVCYIAPATEVKATGEDSSSSSRSSGSSSDSEDSSSYAKSNHGEVMMLSLE